MCDFPFFWLFLENGFLGDSENDLKISVFVAAVESAVELDVDVDVDSDVRFKDPALIKRQIL